VETDAGKAVVIRRLAGKLLGWPTDLEGGRASIFPIGATHQFRDSLNARGLLLVETDAGKAVVIRRLAGSCWDGQPI
jgi:hypothetical protein